MWAVIGWPVRMVLGLVFGKRAWNGVMLWLLGQAPRIWGGKYTAYSHGVRSRDWTYKEWVKRNEGAALTSQLWDDNGCEWVRGYMRFEVEITGMLEGVEQVLADVTADRKGDATRRLGEIIQVLKKGRIG
jgi:hypothetical protein